MRRDYNTQIRAGAIFARLGFSRNRECPTQWRVSLFIILRIAVAGVACRWRRFSANVTRQLYARHTILGDVRPGLQNALRS